MFSSPSAHLSQKDIMEIVEYQSQTRVPSPPPAHLQSGASGGHGQKVRIYIETLFPQFSLFFGLILQTAGSVTAKGEGGGGKHKNGNGSSNGAASSYAAVVTNSNAYTRRANKYKPTRCVTS